ncbi:peptidoglycan-binding protein [Tabrizicola piscis]|uniref:Peptidoglycan-binding protein n=1 Tax=Tabrizicola piscis TaxID=2494374 RepID=A0A3S8U2J1_9RHOB|nr:peptidoglycan-binding domain-containing protein [Tabrizicola piscis]AZL57797.1 peptidoglycan-binding protein [Tabrizicola piscis]
MKFKAIATTALMASLALSPVSPLTAPAKADGKDFIAGAIIGGIIGSAVTNENNKKKSTRSSKASSGTKKSTMSAEQREANKEVQTALNYFGYPVGTADGALGPKSRNAIREYQAFLGYPATGELNDYERTILVTSYHRAVAGGPVIASTVAGSVYGLKAVLIAQRDEMAGAPAGGLAANPGLVAPGSVAAAAAAALPTLVPKAPEAAAVVEEEPKPEIMAAAEEPSLPSFMSPAGAKGSLAAECNAIGLTTAANGGMTTADGMQDANFALGEQFCLARSFAIARGDELTAQIAGFTPDQIAAQCAAFGPVLKDHVAALSLKPSDEVLAGVEGFILTSGMSPAQLSGTAKVCLGAGYVQDDMNVAIGSALLLAAMGERGYSEYLGHHLSQGFGATERPDLAMGWYQMSLDAMGQGQMVVAPGMPGRDALIKKAAYTINGRAAELQPEAKVEEAALPVFELAPEPPVIEEAAVEVAPEPLVIEEAPAELAAAPAPVFVAPDLAEVTAAMPATLPEAAPAPIPAAQDTTVVNAGAQAAMMAARLPFLIFSSF